MRIGFNGRPFCQDQIRGLGRHTLELIKHIHKQHPDVEFFIYSYQKISPYYAQELPYAKIRDKSLSPKIFWDLFRLGRDVKNDQLDLFHSTNNLGVPFFPLSRIPIFTTIHDHFTHNARVKLGMGLRGIWGYLNYQIELFLLKRSKHFFSVSEDAKKKIHQHMGLSLDSITVAYNGANLKPLKKTHDDEMFFLYVGGLEERKNIITMLRAFLEFSAESSSEAKLKIVGSLNSATSEVRELLKNHSSVFYSTGFVTDRELTELYENAEALIFPSLEEGFGLPLVEGMGLGCPIICSDIEVFKEIADGVALFFPAKDSQALKAQLMKLHLDKDLREDLIRKGYKRAEKFTWDAMAHKVFNTYLDFLKR